jgi:acid phosphatase type 7
MKTKLFSAVLILIVLMANNSSFVHAANSSITTVISSEDSYVDSTQPTANFGSGVTMWVRGGTSTQRGLLRFNLSTIPANAQIISAILKLSVSSDGSPVAGNVNTVIGSWAENTVTYSTAPQVGSLIAALPNPASPSSSVSVDLTSYIIGKTSADFYITSLNGDGVRYYTHEKSSTKAPQLLVTWTVDSTITATAVLTKTSTSLPTVTMAPTQTPTNTRTPVITQTSNLPTVTITTPAPNTILTFTPIADSYVQADLSSSNFGSSTQIVLDNSPIRNLLLKFVVSGIGTGSVLNAKLRLYCVDGSPFGGEFHRVADTNWSETTVNWSNAPTEDPSSVATLGKVVASTWYEVDVTSLMSGDGTFSLMALSTSTDGAYYSSKEGMTGFAPQLVITTSASMSTATATPVNQSTLTSTTTLIPTAGPTYTFTPSPTGVPTQASTPGITPSAFPTSPTTESDLRIMAAGDFICDSLTTSSTACQQMAASQVVVDQRPDAALILGDLCHTPSANCFDNYYAPSWGRLFPISHPITGNHEYLVANAIYYFDYWNGVGNADGPAGNRSQGYYSYDIGSWHIIALNSQCSQAGGCNAGSPQYIWLQQDLQNHANLCTLAYYHIPVFSSGGRANNNMKQIYTLLYNNNVEIVLNGHDHIYERFAPQDPNGLADPLRGIREFIVGTGGANHTSIATIQPNSEVRNVDTFGALKLTLHPAGYDWQFLPVPGKTFTDSGTALCH